MTANITIWIFGKMSDHVMTWEGNIHLFPLLSSLSYLVHFIKLQSLFFFLSLVFNCLLLNVAIGIRVPILFLLNVAVGFLFILFGGSRGGTSSPRARIIEQSGSVGRGREKASFTQGGLFERWGGVEDLLFPSGHLHA